MLNAKQRQTHYLFDKTDPNNKIKRRLPTTSCCPASAPPESIVAFQCFASALQAAGCGLPLCRACSRFVRNTVIEFSYKDLLIVPS